MTKDLGHLALQGVILILNDCVLTIETGQLWCFEPCAVGGQWVTSVVTWYLQSWVMTLIIV